LSLEFWRRFYSPSHLFYSTSLFFGSISASFCIFFCPLVCGLSIGFIRQENALCLGLWTMRYVHSCLRKNTGTNSPVITGLLVTTHYGIWMHCVGEGYWEAVWFGKRCDPQQVWCDFFLLNRSSLGWRRWWWMVVLKTTSFSLLKWLFSICSPELLTFSNWALIHGNFLFKNFFSLGSIAIGPLNFSIIYKTVFSFWINQFSL